MFIIRRRDADKNGLALHMQIRADMIQQDAAALAAAFHIGWSIQGAQGAAIARGAALASRISKARRVRGGRKPARGR